MSQLPNPFNANAIDPSQGGGQQLPVGKHPVVITASEIKGAKSNTANGLIEFELQCIGGPAQGQTGTMRLNVFNQSEAAKRIAEGQLSALCHATGVFLLQDTQQLHNIPFAVEVTEQPLTADQKQKQSEGHAVTPFTQINKILMPDGSEVRAGGGGQPAQQAPAPAQQAAAPAAGGWGGAQAQQTQQAAPTPAPAPAATGWGASQQAAAPAQGATGGGWQQGATGATGSAPAWGR